MKLACIISVQHDSSSRAFAGQHRDVHDRGRSPAAGRQVSARQQFCRWWAANAEAPSRTPRQRRPRHSIRGSRHALGGDKSLKIIKRAADQPPRPRLVMWLRDWIKTFGVMIISHDVKGDTVNRVFTWMPTALPRRYLSPGDATPQRGEEDGAAAARNAPTL